MLGITDNQVSGAVGRQIAQVVQRAGEDLVPIGKVPASGALEPLGVARTGHNLGFRQVFNTYNSFRLIRPVLARSCHRLYLPKDSVPWRSSSALGLRLSSNYPG